MPLKPGDLGRVLTSHMVTTTPTSLKPVTSLDVGDHFLVIAVLPAGPKRRFMVLAKGTFGWITDRFLENIEEIDFPVPGVQSGSDVAG